MSSENTRLDVDWTLHTQSGHKLKTGYEHTITKIQVLDIDEPWSGSSGFGANYDKYNAKTYFGAFSTNFVPVGHPFQAFGISFG